MNESKKVKAEANSSKIAFFSFSFNSINFCLSEIDVTTNPKKAGNPNLGIAKIYKPSKNTVNSEETNRTKVNGADKQDTNIADPAEIDRKDANKANKPDIDIEDLAKVDKAVKEGSAYNKRSALALWDAQRDWIRYLA